MNKKEISNLTVTFTVGFIYWLQEYHNLRGLKDIDITNYPVKLEELYKEYNSKYPNGLTGWN